MEGSVESLEPFPLPRHEFLESPIFGNYIIGWRIQANALIESLQKSCGNAGLLGNL